MWHELIMLMKAQITLINQLLTLAMEQKQCLLNSAMEKNREIIKQQESIFSKFTQIETRKQKFLQQKQFENCNIEDNLLNITKLANKQDQRVLAAYIKQLHEVMQKLRTVNQENKKLLDNEVRFIDFNINIMTQTTADDIYAPQGQNGSVISKKKMFDQTI